MRVRVLGRVVVGDDDGPPPSPRDAAVLAALVVHQGKVVATEVLADALWGSDVPASWRKVVQGVVLRHRRRLGPGAIATERDGYRLVLARNEVDAWAFEDGVGRAGALLSDGDARGAESALGAALGLWRDRPYAMLADWLPASAEATRLVELRLLAEERQLEARLALGHHRDAVPLAAALAEREPLREQRWLVLSTALYRSGRQAEALRAIERARRHLADELGLDLGVELTRLQAAVLDHDTSLDGPAEAAPPGESDRSAGRASPYKGLAAYQEGDHDRFHGRDAELTVCRERLGESGALLVVGRSGQGKSSLVCAGLVPRLRSDGGRVVVVRPGPEPLATIERALRGQPDDAVLVVDQAEELFTLAGDPGEREAAAALMLQQLVLGGIVVVLRADHVGSLSLVPDLARALERSSYVLGAMTETGLREAIEAPAQGEGCRVEPALTEVLVQEALGHPAVLPLLSHALHETWEAREDGLLTLAGYRATGGIQGALARTAESVHDGLAPDDQRALRDLLLRMVVLDEEAEPSLRTLDRRSVDGDPAAQRLLTLLVRSRLVTAARDGYVLAHESLVRSWPRLANWLRDGEVAARLVVDLSRAATQWDDDDRHPASLLRGPRLHLAAALTQEEAIGLGRLETALLEASLAADAHDRSALAAQATRERRANRRLRRALTVAAVLLAGLVVAAAVAVSGRSDARAARDRATAAARAALVQGLVSRSAGEEDRSLRALLAVAAYDADGGPGSADALFSLFTDDPGFEGFISPPGDLPIRAVAFVPASESLLVADERAAVDRIDGSGRATSAVALVPGSDTRADPVLGVAPGSGRFVVAARDTTTSQRGAVAVHDLATGALVARPVTLDFVPGAIAVSPDGRWAAVSGGGAGAVVVVDLDSGRWARDLPLPSPATPALATIESAGLAFARSDRLVVGSEGGQVRIVDPSTGAVLDVLDGPPRTSERSLWTDGRRLVTSGADGVLAWDLGTGRALWPEPTALGCLGLVVIVAADRIDCSTAGGQVSTVDLVTGSVSGARPRVTAEPLTRLSASVTGDRLAAVGTETGRVALWRLDGTGPITRLVPGRFDGLAGYEPAGRRLLVSLPDRSGSGTSQGLVNREHVVVEPSGAVLPAVGDAIGSAWVGPGRLLVVRLDFSLALVDVDTAEEVASAPPLDIVAAEVRRDGGAGRVVLFDGIGRLRTLSSTSLLPADPTLDLGHRTSSVAVLPGGRIAVIDDRGVVVIDESTGAVQAGPLPDVAQMVLGPHDTLVVGREDGTVRVLDGTRLVPRGPDLPGAYGSVRAMEVSAEGGRLVVQSGDDLAQLVDLDTGELVGGRLDAPSVSPSREPTIALRPDGLELALRTEEGIARWSLDPAAWRAAACALAGRRFTQEEASRYAELGPAVAATCSSP